MFLTNIKRTVCWCWLKFLIDVRSVTFQFTFIKSHDYFSLGHHHSEFFSIKVGNISELNFSMMSITVIPFDFLLSMSVFIYFFCR